VDAHFIKGCVDARELGKLPDRWPHIAMIGRSNVGKSTLLNLVCQRKQLARASKTPGRTAMINVFALNSQVYLIDLPGYGFAKAAKHERVNWEGLMQGYLDFASKRSDTALFLLDIRRELQDDDEVLFYDLQRIFKTVRLVLTKADKVPAAEIKKKVSEYEFLDPEGAFVVSSLRREGVDILREFILA
jgi:GTP-binding protein